MKKRNNEELVRHFWSMVIKGGNNECWRWRGGHFSTGYPMFHVDRNSIQATRFMLKLISGKYPLMALHHCDNCWCINPNHLYDGNSKENARDRMERGPFYNRHNGHKRAKLVGSALIQFKQRIASGEKPCVIAADFGIHESTACKILKALRAQSLIPSRRESNKSLSPLPNCSV